MRVTTLIKHVLEPHTDKKIAISVNGVLYELGKAFVTDDKVDDNGTPIEYGRVILYAGEPIMDKKN